jgi:hypothetical protein
MTLASDALIVDPAAPVSPAMERAPADTPAPRPAAVFAGALATVRARIWAIAIIAIAALLVAIAWLRTTDYVYTAALRVAPAPTSERETANLGALTNLATLTGATLEAIPVTPFRLYTEGLYTREVAMRLASDPVLMHKAFPREWDAAAHKWHDPAGFGTQLANGLYRTFGVPVQPWRAPDAARLQSWIGEQVHLDQTPKTPIVTLSIDSTDRNFAREFIVRLHTTVDAWLRERTLERTRNNIAYLEARLPTVSLVEHRQALFATLSDQQQRQMMARNPAAYAAEPFGKVSVSDKPTSPRQIPVLALALMLGLAIGIGGALVVPRRHRG